MQLWQRVFRVHGRFTDISNRSRFNHVAYIVSTNWGNGREVWGVVRTVKRLMALSLGVQRAQLEQRIGLVWPRPCLLRPLFL